MKDLVKAAIASMGFDVRRVRGPANASFQLVNALKYFGVDLVLDVGANRGQFASELLDLGYNGRLVSFEPLSQAHQLLSRAARRHHNWRVHPRVAIGDSNRELVINVSRNSVSSSILPMMASHRGVAADSEYVGTESVPVRTLDSVAREYIRGAKMPFLKIDTQGFEWQVLDGAAQTLPLLCGISCELSLIPLYDGQRLWNELLTRFGENGLVLWALDRGFTDQFRGRTLQFDATFFREHDALKRTQTTPS